MAVTTHSLTTKPDQPEGGQQQMQESTFTSYEQLPLFLNANHVAQTLGVSISSAYELMHEKGFPALRIGSRIVVPKEKFRQWVEQQTGGEN
jgi:excisionase family DNA binding protein